VYSDHRCLEQALRLRLDAVTDVRRSRDPRERVNGPSSRSLVVAGPASVAERGTHQLGVPSGFLQFSSGLGRSIDRTTKNPTRFRSPRNLNPSCCSSAIDRDGALGDSPPGASTPIGLVHCAATRSTGTLTSTENETTITGRCPMTDSLPPLSEREQTDESLRLERDRADRALDDEVSEADETADAVINRARARADALLAAARTKTDQTSIGDQPTDALKTARAMEDDILQRERVTADHVLHRERSEHVTLLSQEREATDYDLSHERARSDKALAMRDDFMGIVSHDLLNLLNATVGISSLIEKEVAQENHVERVVAHARRVQRSAARMRRLVGDLVDVASIEAGMLAVTRAVGHPAEVVAEAVETFQAEASGGGISLTAEIAPGVPAIAFDAARILQVLCNLLSNAIKFTPAQGSVVVRLEHIDENVVCCVSDTGEGIPDDKLAAVFDRFVQLKKNDRRGVGLGLFISKCIVHGHGGRIWVENRMGPGSTFCFSLPIDLRTG